MTRTKTSPEETSPVLCKDCEFFTLSPEEMFIYCGNTGRPNFVTSGDRFDMKECHLVNEKGACPDFQKKKKPTGPPHYEQLKDELGKGFEKQNWFKRLIGWPWS